MKRSPIIRRIVMFGILSAMISLVLASLGFGIVEFYKIKNESLARLESKTSILAYNLQPTLVFNDEEAAGKILMSLQDDQSIRKAKVYRPNGEEFAGFTRTGQEHDIGRTQNIYYENRLIGRLEMEAAYLGVKDRYITYFLISLLIIMISIPASFLISAPIRIQVSDSVSQLEQLSNRLRLLADQVTATEQKERKRIAALIHDHLQQILVAGKIHFGQAMRALGRQQYDQAAVSLNRGEEFLSEALRAAKSLTVELRPPILYEDGLGGAFQWLVNRFKNDHNLEVFLHLDDIPSGLPDNIKILLFESAKELLFNVVKYAEIDTAELFLNYKSGWITVAVRDYGRGFDVSQVEKTSAAGGFGLFNIRERLRLLSGEFKVSSYPGGGTHVEISIPIELAEKAPARAMAAPKGPELKKPGRKGKSIKILLADDHKIVREGIANVLKENRLFDVVAQADDGMDAVQKAEKFMPDIVIMDINMPRLNGIEATRVIKNKFADMDIIGLSVQDEQDTVESMKKAGAATLLNKAGDPQELIQTILQVAKK